ncbi:winged helix-turn-helix transcriptional regulator [Streptomyces anulatus]
MPSPTQPPAFSFDSVDPERIDHAIARIGPKWTTWSTMILAQENRPMRVREISAQLPFVAEQSVSQRLLYMQADGLVTRSDVRRRGTYQLSALGESLAPVHRTLSDWSRAHLPLQTMAEAERVEDALGRLNLRHTTGVIQALGTNGPLRFSHIAEEIGVDRPAARQRLLRMQADGLVGRAGSHHGAPYVLTDAGQSLGAVYATIEHWSEPFTALKTSSSPVRVAAATRTHTNVPLTGDGARTAAALRRSTAAPNDLFSHAPQPQPRMPAAVTARSAPGRGR